MTFLATNNVFAQKTIKFKDTKNKPAKVVIQGKIITTIKRESGTDEYYVNFDDKNKQVVMSMVMYSPKSTYLGCEAYFCKYEDFHIDFLKNTALADVYKTDPKEPQSYYYNFSAKNGTKFPIKVYTFLEEKESNSEKDNVTIRFVDKSVAEKFLADLKKKVGI